MEGNHTQVDPRGPNWRRRWAQQEGCAGAGGLEQEQTLTWDVPGREVKREG